MTLRKSGHGSLAGGPIMLRKGWPHDPAKIAARWPHDPANRQTCSLCLGGASVALSWCTPSAVGVRSSSRDGAHGVCRVREITDGSEARAVAEAADATS